MTVLNTANSVRLGTFAVNKIMKDMIQVWTSLFSVASLFASNQQGIWLEPNDINNYMAVGPELVSNGTFDSGTAGWTSSGPYPSSAAAVNGEFQVTATGAYGRQTTPITCVIGKQYQFLVSARRISGTDLGSVGVGLSATGDIGSNEYNPNSTNYAENIKVIFTATATTHYVFVGIGASNTGTVFAYDNISVRELTALASASMFQDSAGSTVDTGREQPNGLILDKRLGLVRGPELIANGTFATDTTGWTTGNGATLSVVGGRMRVTNGAASFGFCYATVTCVVGKVYELTLNQVDGVPAGTLVGIDSSPGGGGLTVSTSGNRIIFTATSSTMYISPYAGGNTIGNYSDYDNFSVKLLDGNHAFQATSASRPVLSARKNIILYSEDLQVPGGNPFWYHRADAVVTPNQGPAGFYDLDQINNPVSGGSGTGVFYAAGGYPAANRQYAAQVVLAAVSGTTQALLRLLPFGGGDPGTEVTVNLTTTPTVFTVTAAFGAGAINQVFFEIDPVTVNVPILAGRVQIETGLVATSYQRSTLTNDYANTGFMHYLKFDGVDDSVGTGTFPAGTLANNMDCFMLVRRDTAADVLFLYGNPSQYIAVTAAGSAMSPSDGSGSPTYFVDGVSAGATRGSLHTALTAGNWHILEMRGIDLSLWTEFNLGNYGGFKINGAIAEVILAPAQSAGIRTQIREQLAAKAGITL